MRATGSDGCGISDVRAILTAAQRWQAALCQSTWINDLLVGVRLDFCQNLYCIVAANIDRLNKRHIEFFQIYAAMDVDPAASCRGFDRQV